ncbi:hypothetical protein F1728_19450 [Gimesia benthica]|uniref:Uncharacterized protein n=1 Tax=Gimesia benthica TaxID=2608982 RepID=A0A6I6AJA0_9PLAN|nr:hypothetical protein [Gimesia benthica]QGQ24729.1 hypothetical protein F1728_19450 [Gimesia benthica]
MSSIQKIEIPNNHGTFTFELCHRELNFGGARQGEYYWMDGRKFRNGSGGSNFRSCIDFWWACAEEANEADDLYNQENLVQAEIYSLINTSRAMQNVFLDAHLHKLVGLQPKCESHPPHESQKPSKSAYNLPEEEIMRLRQIVDSRNVLEVQNELEQLFLGDQPEEKDSPQFAEKYESWIKEPLDVFRTGGRQTLQEYIQSELKQKISKHRKRGNNSDSRLFLNMFSYESKVAFYRCYASAWAFILPTLEQYKGVNELSVRFMGMWHHQNQPGEIEGKVYHIFSGQVLSLHPLSAFVLNDSTALSVIGNWVGNPQYQHLIEHNKVADSPEYWEVVLIILIAANEYKQSHQKWDESRGKKELVNSPKVAHEASISNDLSVAENIEDYLAQRSVFCEECAGFLEYQNHLATGGQSVLNLRCRSCGQKRNMKIESADFEKYFFDSSDADCK